MLGVIKDTLKNFHCVDCGYTQETLYWDGRRDTKVKPNMPGMLFLDIKYTNGIWQVTTCNYAEPFWSCEIVTDSVGEFLKSLKEEWGNTLF
jgi:hypothetical protein